MTDALPALHEQFLAEQRFAARRSPTTVAGYRQSFATLSRLFPNLSLEALTPSLLVAFFRRLETRTRFVGRGLERRGVRASTVASYRSKLGRFFGWLLDQGHLASNPLATIPYPRVEYDGRQYLDRAAIERIFASLALPPSSHSLLLRRRNLALFALLLYTGLRRGELLGLRVADLNLERHELTVRGETSKSRLRRIIPLNSKAVVALEDYLAELGRRLPITEHLFSGAAGVGALTENGLKHLVAAVMRRSGVRFHLHQFRHTFAINFLNAGGDIARLQQLLGHRDIRMTSTYLRCLPTRAMRDGVERLELETLL